jgi:hypothetical protein
MAKYIGASAARATLDTIKAKTTKLYLHTLASQTNANVTTGFLVSANVTAGGLTVAASGGATGPTLTVGAITGAPIEANGTCNYLYLVSAGNRIQAITSCSAQTLNSANTVDIGSFVITSLVTATNTD